MIPSTSASWANAYLICRPYPVLVDKNATGRKKKKAKGIKPDIPLTEPEVKMRFHGNGGGALIIE
jgi:hypothetical protein